MTHERLAALETIVTEERGQLTQLYYRFERAVQRIEALEAAERQRQPIDKDMNHDPLVLPTIEETYGHDDVRELVLAAREVVDCPNPTHDCEHGPDIERLAAVLKYFKNIR